MAGLMSNKSKNPVFLAKKPSFSPIEKPSLSTNFFLNGFFDQKPQFFVEKPGFLIEKPVFQSRNPVFGVKPGFSMEN